MAYYKCGSVYATDNSDVRIGSASGGVANFNTSLALPLVNLTAYFKATQEAGTPTPQSPKAISGVSAVSVFHRGANLFDISTKTDGKALKWGDGDTFNDVKSIVSDYIEVKEGVKFTSNYMAQWCCYDKNINYLGNILSGSLVTTSGADRVNNTIPSGYGIYYLRLGFRSALNNNEDMTEKTDIVLSVGNTALPFEAYNGATTLINLGGTYYGGHFTQDKAGHRQFEVTHGIVDLGEQSWNYGTWGAGSLFSTTLSSAKPQPVSSVKGDIICSIYNNVTSSDMYSNNPNYSMCLNNNVVRIANSDYSNKDTFKSAMSEIMLVYELATPYVIDLPDGEPITTLVGTNNIYADAGDCSVEYKVSIEEYVSAHSGGGLGGGLLGGGLGGAKSGGSEEETDNTEDTEKVKLDETKEEIKEEPKEEKIDEPLTRQER